MMNEEGRIMRTLTKTKSYAEVMVMPKNVHRKPMRQSMALRMLVNVLSRVDLKLTSFSYEKI